MTKNEADFIKNFDCNRKIISQFMVINKEIKQSSNNRHYIEVKLQDKTGQISARKFQFKQNEYDKIEINKVHNVVGKIQEFPLGNGTFNILIDDINPAKKFDIEEFTITLKNRKFHEKILLETIHNIENKDLKLLLKSFFTDEQFYKSFINAPAAKIHHHNFKGGLLQHTNEVASICRNLCDIYPEINKDLLITGAILHDIGKIRTYDYETESIDINEEGRLLDHLYIGAQMIDERASKLKIDNTVKTQLIHLILSHHGETSMGYGSTVNPRIVEAVALHKADDMSAKITSFLDKS